MQVVAHNEEPHCLNPCSYVEGSYDTYYEYTHIPQYMQKCKCSFALGLNPLVTISVVGAIIKRQTI